MKAIFKREISSYFLSPVGYIVLAVFYFLSGFFFFASSLAGNTANMSGTFDSLFTIVMFVTPIITMRLFSEDKKQKTDQVYLTAPIKLTSIVLGKYLAALCLFLICTAITLVYAAIIASFTQPAWSVIFANFLGLFLLGSAVISVGMFLSALTENQITAAMLAFIIGIFILMMDSMMSMLNDLVSKVPDFIPVKFIVNSIKSLSFTNHYFQSFPLGLLKLEDIIFFLSACTVFVFLTVRVFEKKRWS